ncbi:mitochondrial inner membrane protein required for protein import [Apophysomyces ossiformis]|uniref:Mitochondrial import inner membrane translocase subunit TIM50 n=1 Tax=Apophysomyces ossiformis TaxID=679940 RepID=A0A8H7BW20_9FUNG|nr:mitochondrial inner membrane protein required for protein import [Apophysomyces ossiformis]
MFRQTIQRFQRSAHLAARRAYASTPEQQSSQALLEEALARKAGRKATLPKGEKKPTKQSGEGDSTWKTIALGSGAATGLGLGSLFYFGRPFEDGRVDKYAEENGFVAAYNRCIDRFKEFQNKLNEPAWEKILPDVPEQYRAPFTLVINLSDTLVHSTWDKQHGWRHAKRPGVDYFLSYLSQFYEIVIFTSQQAMNAQPILDKLDPYNYALYRVYREGTRYVDGKFVKDLSHLNRDLGKVIIMDCSPEAFSLQPENGVALKPWHGEPDDRDLLSYIPFLEVIAVSNPDDVRPILKSFEGKHIPTEWAKREAQMKEEHRKLWLEEQASKKGKRNLGSLFSAQEEQEPPPTVLEQRIAYIREAFNAEQENMKKQQDEMMQAMKMQQEKMGEMKMTVWEMMSHAASGQPLLPPDQLLGEPQSQQQ